MDVLDLSPVDPGPVTCLSGDNHSLPGRVSTHRGWRGVQQIFKLTYSLVSLITTHLCVIIKIPIIFSEVVTKIFLILPQLSSP